MTGFLSQISHGLNRHQVPRADRVIDAYTVWDIAFLSDSYDARSLLIHR